MILGLFIISLLQTYCCAIPSQSGRVTIAHPKPNCHLPCGPGALCLEDSNGKATCRFYKFIYLSISKRFKNFFFRNFFRCQTGLIPILTPLQGCVGCSNDAQCRHGKICENHRCTSKIRTTFSSSINSCPINVWPLPTNFCRGRRQKSQCWSPGVRDTDCPNHGLCCYDGCAYTCYGNMPLTTTSPSTTTATTSTTTTTTTTTTTRSPLTWYPCSTPTTTTTTISTVSGTTSTTLTRCWDNFQCPMGETCEMPWMMCVKKVPCASMSKACEMLINIAGKFDVPEDYISGICPVPCTL